MSSQDSHSAHATDEYRSGWDRIFAKPVRDPECRRHRSPEHEDVSERCTCKDREK